MTFAEIVGIFDARRVGPDQCAAHCPGPIHRNNDRHSSLGISAASDGSTTLIHCHAGCRPEDVLQAVGLSMRDLFDGPPPSPAQLRQAAEERERREAEARRGRQAHGAACDLVHALESVLSALGNQLVLSPENDALAALYHAACDKLHAAEEREESLRP
jgi:hypothetical protein